MNLWGQYSMILYMTLNVFFHRTLMIMCVCVCERTVLCSDFNVIIKRRRIIIHAPSGSTYVYTHQSSAVNPAFSNNFVHGILSVFEYIININGFFPRPPRHFNQSPIIKLIDSHSIELKTNPKDIWKNLTLFPSVLPLYISSVSVLFFLTLYLFQFLSFSLTM